MTALSDLPHVLTVEEAALILRCSRSAAYAAARSGQLPTIRISRCLRVPRHRLEQMLGGPLQDDEPDANATSSRSGNPIRPNQTASF